MPAYIQNAYFHAACGQNQHFDFDTQGHSASSTSTGQACQYFFMHGRPKSSELDEIIEQVCTAVEYVITASQLTLEQRKKTALLLGSTSLDIGAVPRKTEQTIWLNTIDYLSKQVQQNCQLNDFHLVFNTACTASFNAIITAEKLISSNKFEHVIVVGCEFFNQLTLDGFDSLDLISQQAVKSFLNNRDGLILGEGVAALLISQQTSLDTPYIKLHRGASGCDLYSLTMTDEQGKHIQQIIEQALQQAHIQPEQIDLIKAHGTATENNDLAESAALENCFSTIPSVWALKPFTGHTLGACGALELAIMHWLLKQKIKLPSHLTNSDNSIVPMLTDDQQLTDSRFILLNHCGFGGNNAAMVTEIVTTEN
ncbi:beta-ketoacyl synthase [Catenovulum agarivorans DS-2]|uniref:Beta-ketoacyl synthase n=1 Tax=Catenovulum agarivorans DS-2 TaxID=1328313 RepID=W7QZ24_9ALTE|nr:beta-ketoacyl synthase N-terminal-like domain-containing protein [Catenovulum agarivorans]EWH10595.1 beta-ketoacyl synthase [Catenovulum agarivorans DS-2]